MVMMYSHCRFVVTCLLALFARHHHHALAWTAASIGGRSNQQSSPPTALFAGARRASHPSTTTSSRRQWISKTVTAAGISSLLPPLPSLAASANKVKTSAAICDPTVSVLQNRDRLIYVLGTAHISDVSAQLARQLVKDVRPDAVFVELDLKRVGGLPFNRIQRKQDRLEIPGPYGNCVIVPNIIPVSKTIASLSQSQQQAAITAFFDGIDFGSGVSEEHKEALASLLAGGVVNPGAGISSMYENLSKQGFKPGQEFVLAVKEGQNIGADIVLGDQDAGVTLQRLAQAAQMTDYRKMNDPNSQLELTMKELTPPSSNGSSQKKQLTGFIENMKNRENVRRVMGQMREQAPAMVQAMLDERDAYMAAGLDILNDKNVITAVMGIAHVDGVERNLQAKGWKLVNPMCPREP